MKNLLLNHTKKLFDIMKIYNTKCINLFGAPNAGKSTLSSELYSILKKRGISCELVSEYAKDLIYRENMLEVSDQLKVLAEQHYRTRVLDGKVEYIVNDAPFLSSAIYFDINQTYLTKIPDFKKVCVELHKQYDNLDYIIKANMNFTEKEGRIHNNVQTCEKIEQGFINLMEENNFEYTYCDRDKFIEIVLNDINQ